MRGWPLLRLVLAVVYAVLIGFVVGSHRTEAPLRALYDDVERGAVERVEVLGGLSPGSTGYAEQVVAWQTGHRRWVAHLAVVRGQSGSPGVDGERTDDDVVAEVRRRDPDVQVLASDRRSGFSAQAYGVPLPGLLAVPMLAGLVGGFLLLVNGPEPWRATRWGWFWLSGVPGGVLAYLALSGPTPGLPRPHPGGSRLTGGFAFCIALFLGALLTGALTLLAQVVWPPHPA